MAKDGRFRPFRSLRNGEKRHNRSEERKNRFSNNGQYKTNFQERFSRRRPFINKSRRSAERPSRRNVRKSAAELDDEMDKYWGTNSERASKKLDSDLDDYWKEKKKSVNNVKKVEKNEEVDINSSNNDMSTEDTNKNMDKNITKIEETEE